MKAYVYQAALYCEVCGLEIRNELIRTGAIPETAESISSRAHRLELDEGTYNSDDFPKGPYPDGGGEADCPQHCDSCGVFLKNPLTIAGYEHVKEILAGPYGSPEVREMWRCYYGDGWDFGD